MRWIHITRQVNVNQLYAKVSCDFCRGQYSFHIRRAEQFRTCPCGRATFYFKLKQYKNYIGFALEWVGPYMQRTYEENKDVDAIEIAEKDEVPWEEGFDDRGEGEWLEQL